MGKFSTSKMSSKGQVVIPEDIRNMLGLEAGVQFVVIAEIDKDVVILKPIVQPNMEEYGELIKKARKAAKNAGLTKSSLNQVIKGSRGK